MSVGTTATDTPWWALFTDDGEHYANVYTSESDADEDLWGRPDGVYVGRACQCVGPVRPAGECSTCCHLEDE